MNVRGLLRAGALLIGAWVTARAIRTARYTLRDKVAVITGGSRGLGLVLARHICAQGGKVAIIARDPEELERAKVDLGRRSGAPNAFGVKCELLDASQIESAVQVLIDGFGKVDILINNDGVLEVGRWENMTRAYFERDMRMH